jgi:glycosyltransferase involved in cell wall biosynthesis
VTPRVVLGMPAYARPDALPCALESLLSQTRGDFALLIVDDAASADVAAIVEAYARDDARIRYEANPRRLGMVDNWRRVFRRARELWPGSEYFAWVSDHDVWHARWLQEMVAVLDANPRVVLAYPRSLYMLDGDAKASGPGFETFGMTSPGRRIRHAARHLLAGDMIYGLMRADALEAAGVFHRVVTPDRQVLLALSLFGEIRQVPEMLWYRDMRRTFDIARQRQVFFPGGPPLYIYLPSHLQHVATLLYDFAIRGRGRPRVGRMAALGYAALQFGGSMARHLTRVRSNRAGRPSFSRPLRTTR